MRVLILARCVFAKDLISLLMLVFSDAQIVCGFMVSVRSVSCSSWHCASIPRFTILCIRISFVRRPIGQDHLPRPMWGRPDGTKRTLTSLWSVGTAQGWQVQSDM